MKKTPSLNELIPFYGIIVAKKHIKMVQRIISHIENNLFKINQSLSMDDLSSLDSDLNRGIDLKNRLHNVNNIRDLEKCIESIYVLKIKIYFRNYLFDEIDNVYEDSIKILSQQNAKITNLYNKCISQKEEVLKYREKELEKKKKYETLCKYLKQYEFKNADILYKENSEIIDITDYEKLKSKYIQNFLENLGIDINEEQSQALSLIATNNLITARAGSGKTRTIACKAILSIEKEDVTPEEIMILAFNKKAAQEINQRIRSDFKYDKFNPNCARTFHSLAYAIVRPTEEIIWDDPNEDARSELSVFISKLYHSPDIWQEIKDYLYNFFKNDNNKGNDIDKYWSFESDANRYLYLRNLKYVTLNGENVKSNGEKWIADFLFEHNINYGYEKLLGKIDDRLYKPDFKIYANKKEYCIEHWGINEFDKNRKVPEYWTKTWDEYYNEMQWKRKYFQNNKNKVLIETSILDMINGENIDEKRSNFEIQLKLKLEKQGIICEKLPFEKIIRKLHVKHKDSMSTLYRNFIQAARRAEMSPKDIDQKLSEVAMSEKNIAFVKMANSIYKRYEKALEKQNKMDFDTLLKRSIQKIHETQGNCEIYLGSKKIKIKNLKMLLIDEYQDFSKLFFKLVEAIKKYNPEIKLFCVGDDWQAINGFAGSDLYYFKNFENIFGNCERANLSLNYRSGVNIVEAGNTVMLNRGTPAIAYNKKINSSVNCIYIDDISPFNKTTKDIDKNFLYDKNLNAEDNSTNFFNVNHRYFKACYNIISRNSEKSYIIMARKNTICSNEKLNIFGSMLLEKLSSAGYKDLNIKVDTVHKFKGAEADIVIILECDNMNFPLLHPSNEYMQIFGRSLNTIINEERRLFYVAITRAKEDLFCLLEKGCDTEFFDKIKLNTINPE